MRIEEGKYYRTRDGRKVGPMVFEGGGEWEFEADVDGGRIADGTYCAWREDGSFDPYDGKKPHRLDLVAEWVEPAAQWFLDTPNGPIRTETVTVRRLEPGVYGRVQVRDEAGVVGFNFVARNGASMGASAVAYLNAPELRELARVALEIAEYLDAQ